ncbi:Uncharacterised protein [Bordetella pertussis]|nr:Uncharacterised protein [Bordetella pertussis]
MLAQPARARRVGSRIQRPNIASRLSSHCGILSVLRAMSRPRTGPISRLLCERSLHLPALPPRDGFFILNENDLIY